jgi:hypothetical protein
MSLLSLIVLSDNVKTENWDLVKVSWWLFTCMLNPKSQSAIIKGQP